MSELDRPVWGAPAIAAIINRSTSQAYYLLKGVSARSEDWEDLDFNSARASRRRHRSRSGGCVKACSTRKYKGAGGKRRPYNRRFHSRAVRTNKRCSTSLKSNVTSFSFIGRQVDSGDRRRRRYACRRRGCQGPTGNPDQRRSLGHHQISVAVMTKNFEFHDMADLFPMLNGDELKAMATDIFDNGQREPITLFDGKILDGRNRYVACLDAGIEPLFTEYNGCRPVDYVVSLNLKRRHLNESQRAMVAAKLANLSDGQRADRIASSIDLPTAAKMLNVSELSIKRGKTVQREADPEIVKAVEAASSLSPRQRNSPSCRRKNRTSKSGWRPARPMQ